MVAPVTSEEPLDVRALASDTTFCILPFVSFNMEVAGAVRPCAENHGSFGSARTERILSAWNSPAWCEMRRSFLAGEHHPSCSYCWHLEQRGVRSYRNLNNEWHKDLLPELTSAMCDRATGAMHVPPRIVVFKMSSICNLACRMCTPSVSTAVRRHWDAELERITGERRGAVNVNYPEFEQLQEELRTIAPRLAQISFSGGEPFADRRAIAVLKTLRPWASTIRFYANSNLSMLHNGGVDILELLHEYAEIMISISVDGPPALQRYTRPGLDFEQFERNVRALQADPSVVIHSNTAIYAVTALHLPEIVDYILREIRPARFNISLSTKPGLEHMDARALPTPLRTRAMWRIRDFLKRLERYGDPESYLMQDVRAALETVMGFLRSEELNTPENQQRLASYMRRLDGIHGTDLAGVDPELARVLSGIPEYQGMAATRSGPAAGMPRGARGVDR